MKDRKEEHDMHRDKRRQINHKFNFINLRTILIVLLLFLTNLIVLTLYRKIDKNSESLLYKFLAKNKHRFGEERDQVIARVFKIQLKNFSHTNYINFFSNIPSLLLFVFHFLSHLHPKWRAMVINKSVFLMYKQEAQ